MQQALIQGAKGGDSSTRAPVESADSLRSIAYFRILDLISEGEIGGLVNGLQSIYLDKTPLANNDGSLNFKNVQVVTRNGTQDQTYIPGYPAVENQTTVNVELRSDAPWVHSLTNLQLSAVGIMLEVNGLSQTNTSNGDITGYTIAYIIEVQTDGGAYQTAYTGSFTGKTTTTYQRSHRIDLPAAQIGWNVRVTRLTANAHSSYINDTTTVSSYTEIIDAKLAYPNSALVAISGDASQFTNVPARAYDMWGRIVQVPSNYDPLARTYAGVWDGTFKLAWTDNPAWAFYDLALHLRYGLGNLITAAQINKWWLYSIAQYCDEMVPDGMGGMEPRFTCNIFLQTTADAYKVLSDIASVFRGISYWGAGAINTSADMPQDPVYVYTAANVIEGLFTYSDSARKTRYTTAQVTWNDPRNFYLPTVEYVQNDAALARYGIQPVSITAFGCTSQGQAQRAGQWVLLTSQLETDTVVFKVGLDGIIAAPGQIIRVQDPSRAGKRQGGRISAVVAGAGTTIITVDRAPDAIAIGDSLTVVLPTGVSETQTVKAINGNAITCAPFSTLPAVQSVWVSESATLEAQTFRVISVSEDKSDTDISFTITAVEHNTSKFDAIDNGTIIQIPPISSLPSSIQGPVASVTLSGNVVVAQGIANNVLTIAWPAATGAAQYQVKWRKDNGDWVNAGTVASTSCDVQGIYTGNYQARVCAISPGNVVSVPTLSAVTPIQGKTGAPPSLTFLTAKSLVFGIALQWGFPPVAEDSQRTEIWYSQSPDIATASKLGDFAYPQNSNQMLGLAAGVSFFFWGRIVDKTGNIGPWYPTGAGVNGQASSDATTILSYLGGQIGETQLAQDLLGPIKAITPDMAGDPSIFAGDTTKYAGVWSQLYAQQDGDNALAKQIDTVAASTAGFGALVQTETQARIDGDSALASQVTTVQATAGNAQALAQTAATTAANVNGSVSASYQIKVQIDPGTGKYYAAGMAIGVDNSTGIAQSQILFQADRFALIGTANGNIASPFVIQNGQTFINQAFIGSGWITNAMIGNQIESTSVNAAGLPTWEINKTGTRYVRGDQFTITEDSNGWRMTNSGGVVVIEMGVLS